MTARVLVAYHSRTGRSRALAEVLAAALGADLEVIRDARTDRGGALGFLRSGLEALLGTSAEIVPPHRDPRAYDLVVIGGPVWLHRPSSPMRAYLELQRARLPRIALFATYDVMGVEAALERMSALAGRAPLAQLAIRRAELASGAASRITGFAKQLLERLGAPAEVTG